MRLAVVGLAVVAAGYAEKAFDLPEAAAVSFG